MSRRESYKGIPNRILKWLDMSCLSQKDAANIMGHGNGAQLSRWQHGKKLPDLVNLIKLSYTLSLNPSSLEELYPRLCEQIKKEISARKKGIVERTRRGEDVGSDL